MSVPLVGPWPDLSVQANWPATVGILGCALLLFIAFRANPWALICWTRALRARR